MWQQRLQARRAYQLRPKAKPDQEGQLRTLCPAASTFPTVRCELKKSSQSERTAGKTRVFLTDDVRLSPPKICRQQSATFPPTAGAKYLQDLAYGTEEEWHPVYSTLRNTIEGFNGLAKDHSYEALGDADRRRIRGQAAQSVFVAFLIFGANLRKIDVFRDLCVIGDDGIPTRPRGRSTPPLSDFLPESAARGGDPPEPA